MDGYSSPAPRDCEIAGHPETKGRLIPPASPRRRRRPAATAAILAALALLALPASAAAATLGLTAGDAPVGQPIEATAELTGGENPTGTISFEVFGPSNTDCSGTPLSSVAATAPVTANGSYTSEPFSPQLTGSYSWKALYSGDLENLPAESPCATSSVAKATPTLAGTATSAITFGLTITDQAEISGFAPTGTLVFSAFGPDDPSCANLPAYTEAVPINGNGSYSPAGFNKPPPGRYLWQVEYAGDANNLGVKTACDAPGQASAVGTLVPTLTATATGNTVGAPVTATATLGNGASPGGQLTFRAFAPGDPGCSAPAAFSSTVPVSGNGTYAAPAFTPAGVGTYRWTVAYSGDPFHVAAATACGAAASAIAKANPTIAGRVGGKLTVGTRFRDTATLAGGFAPGGTITFEIYLPGNNRCEKPDFVNTVAVNGDGTYSSDPFVAKRAGRHRFLARYSGDASNQAATEACASPAQLARVGKRVPKLRPRAQLIGPQQISIRARIAGAASPSGVVSFRLFGPGDRSCTARPAFSGSLRVGRNGTFALAEYIATRPGVYRLAVAYSGDPRNAKAGLRCAAAQTIAVRG